MKEMARLGLPRPSSKLKSALEAILSNRIEQRQGEVRELKELQRDLREMDRIEDSKVWGVLDRLWK